MLQVAEKILNKKQLEFYKWDGDLSQLLQNVREKLNKVSEVTFFDSYLIPLHLSCDDPENAISMFSHIKGTLEGTRPSQYYSV